MAHAGGDGAGGISRLVALLKEHGGAIDADLQRFYGVSLNDWAGGRISTRRLGSLIRELPSEGTAFHRAILRASPERERREPPDEWWTPERDFLATLIDLKRAEMWGMSSKEARSPVPPAPIPRPGVRQPKPRNVDVDPRRAMAILQNFAPTQN